MITTWGYVESLLRTLSVSASPPGQVLSVDSTLGEGPDLFDAVVVNVTSQPPGLLLRKVDSNQQLSVDFTNAKSFDLRRSEPSGWTLLVVLGSGGWILFSTKPR